MPDLTDFDTQVLQRSREVPVVVDFWAPWCGPCQMIGPILDKLAGEAADRWDLVKVNTEEHQELSARYEIRSIPCLKLFRDGEAIDEILGAFPEPAILQWIEGHLPSPHAGDIATAEEAIARGHAAEAAAILEKVLAEEPENEHVLFLLAQTRLATNPEEVDALIRRIPGHSEFWDRAEGLRELVRLVALENTPAKLPDTDARDAFLTVLRQLRESQFKPALEGLAAILESDRTYRESVAAEACRANFTFLGPRHPVSEEFQRRISSLLFA